MIRRQTKMQNTSLLSFMKERFLSKKVDTVIFAVVVAFFLGSGVYFACVRQIRDALLCLLFAFTPLLVPVLERLLRLSFPTLFLVAIFFIPVGNMLGCGFDFYTIIPPFDTILHTVSGFVFACLGFGLFTKLVDGPNERKNFYACLLFGFAFSMTIALLWELFEYGCSLVGPVDMQEDTIIDGFMSYLLAGTHSAGIVVQDITQTVITFGDGQTLVIDGYLDIGLIDTMVDVFVCLVGATVYCVVLGIAESKCKKLSDLFLPVTRKAEVPVTDDASYASCPTAATL